MEQDAGVLLVWSKAYSGEGHMTPEELDAMTDEQLYDHLRQHTDGSLDPVIARLEAGHMLARDIARDVMADERRRLLAHQIADHEQLQSAILDAQALAEEWAAES